MLQPRARTLSNLPLAVVTLANLSPTTINEANLSSTVVTPLLSNAMSVDPIPATPAITNKRLLNTISLDSDSETGTEGDHFAPSSTLIGSTGLTGSKTTVFSSSVKKVSELHRSSTTHSSSPISKVSHGLKPSSLSPHLSLKNHWQLVYLETLS